MVHGLVHGFKDAAVVEQFLPAGRKGTIAGQHQPVGLGHHIGVRGNNDGARVGLARHALECLFSRMQVAAFVVDDSGQHLQRTLG